MIRKFKNLVRINKKETDNGIFFYFDIEIDYKRTVRVWIGRDMHHIIEDRYGTLCIEFPIKGCEIIQGKKANTLIVKKGTKNAFFLDTDQKEGLLEIEKITSPSGQLNLVAQKVVLDATRTLLATTDSNEIILEWRYIYSRRNHRHEINGILGIDINKNKLLLENISLELMEDIKKELE